MESVKVGCIDFREWNLNPIDIEYISTCILPAYCPQVEGDPRIFGKKPYDKDEFEYLPFQSEDVFSDDKTQDNLDNTKNEQQPTDAEIQELLNDINDMFDSSDDEEKSKASHSDSSNDIVISNPVDNTRQLEAARLKLQNLMKNDSKYSSETLDKFKQKYIQCSNPQEVSNIIQSVINKLFAPIQDILSDTDTVVVDVSRSKHRRKKKHKKKIRKFSDLLEHTKDSQSSKKHKHKHRKRSKSSSHHTESPQRKKKKSKKSHKSKKQPYKIENDNIIPKVESILDDDYHLEFDSESQKKRNHKTHSEMGPPSSTLVKIEPGKKERSHKNRINNEDQIIKVISNSAGHYHYCKSCAIYTALEFYELHLESESHKKKQEFFTSSNQNEMDSTLEETKPIDPLPVKVEAAPIAESQINLNCDICHMDGFFSTEMFNTHLMSIGHRKALFKTLNFGSS